VEVSGGFFSTKLIVPSSAIANVEHETVHLNVASSEIDGTGWQQRPRTSDELRNAAERDVDRDI
jgi:hypothetical protein